MPTASKKLTPKSTKKPQAVTVAITPRLQIGFIALYLLAYLALVAPMAYNMVRYQANYFTSNWVQAFSAAIPLLLFLVALVYVGNFSTKLGRVFKAAFLSLVGVFLYMAAQVLVLYMPLLQPELGGNWESAYRNQQLVTNVSVLVLFGGALAYVKWQRRKSTRG